eukprot:TRINITY_DN3903_c0_g1_i8.p1 TRINITY_DN3903_c0_g1~~TRINITY_DN3903_c0_g1_i8.p1  ORF type:complete len:113 (-),score=11.83 TRINITY_DN3903_c0_g1_i8:170-508(-)
MFLVLAFLFARAEGSPYYCQNYNGSYFSQCDPRWGNIPLGFSTTDTICSAGCAMTSVCMALYTWNAVIYNDIAYPTDFNQWLMNNNGYADGDLLVWNSVAALGIALGFNLGL